MSDDTPDLATVAEALAGALTPDRQADLDALIAADPAARATFARHERSLTATSRLLASQPAPAMPVAVADSLDAALRAAAASRAPVAARPPTPVARVTVASVSPVAVAARAPATGPDGSQGAGRRIRRFATNFALAAVVIGGLVLAVTQLDGSGARDASSGTSGSALSATAGAAAGAAVTTPRATTAGSTTRAGPTTPAAAAVPVPGRTGPAPTARPGAAAASPGTTARLSATTAVLSAAQLPAGARALAADGAATTAACPSRPGTRTSLRLVRYAGAPAWLAVTPLGDALLAEVTRTVCGGALLSRSLPRH